MILKLKNKMDEVKVSKWNHWNLISSLKYPHEKVIQFFFRNFPKERRAVTNVLDLGCGSGVHTLFLAEEGFKVYATDISNRAIENTKNKLAEKKLNIEVLEKESISAISFPNSFFDVVLSIGVFDAAGYEETKKAIPLISSILKNDGIGFFIFASKNDFRVQEQNNQYDLYGYSDEEVESLFLKNHCFNKVWIDKYITTYQNKTLIQEDFIVTVFK